ncbi:MAG TPA: antibiotic biosynthesis monooxygenase [Bacteroidales bacterium]|nr:antibiotic biosynthesis monooxygenase [Bacteroidales bacterium]
MIVTCVYVSVKPGTEEVFIKETTLNHLESVKEPGNLRFDIIREEDNPLHFMIYEAYVSTEAALMHKETAHYLKWRDAVAGMMAEPRKGVRYKLIQPEFH